MVEDVYDNRGFMLEEWILNDDMLTSLTHKKVLVGELLRLRLENRGLRDKVRYLEIMKDEIESAIRYQTMKP